MRMLSVAEGIRAVHIPGTPTSRLHRGFHAWIRGVQEFYGDERIHQFVRALEAVIRPAEGRGRRHFVYRGQLFTGRSAENEALLTEIFNMRGSVEHLNHMEDALQTYLVRERETIARQRLYQAQLLTSHVYERVFSSLDVRKIFDEDGRASAFWQLPRPAQTAQWGAQIDLAAWAAARFHQ